MTLGASPEISEYSEISEISEYSEGAGTENCIFLAGKMFGCYAVLKWLMCLLLAL